MTRPMTQNPSSLLLVGCGKMGGALLTGWEAMDMRFDVIEPNTSSKHAHATWHANLESLPEDYAPDIIVLAVKPQQLEQLLPDYKKRFSKNTPLYISIAAGKNLSFYHSHLGDHAHVVRVMPNTPTLVKKGMSVLCARNTISAHAKKVASQLLETVGKVEWLEDEALMDAVTSISGSGPAYVFLFADSLTKAGVAAGLPESLAKTLALETIAGSCALANESKETLENLRKNVTSPGGTTAAALDVFMANNALEDLTKQAVFAAKARSKALSS